MIVEAFEIRVDGADRPLKSIKDIKKAIKDLKKEAERTEIVDDKSAAKVEKLNQTIGRLTGIVKENSAEQRRFADEAKAAGETGATAYNQLKAQIKTTQNDLRDLIAAGKGQSDQANELRQRLSALQQTQKDVNRDVRAGGNAYRQMTSELAATNDRIKELMAQQAQGNRLTQEESQELERLKHRYQELRPQIDNIEQSVGQFQRNVGNYKSALESLGGSFANIFGVGGLVAGGAIAVQQLGRSLLNLGRQSLQLADQQEKAEAQVQALIRASGGAVGFTSDQLNQLAADLQNNSLFGDEEILEKVTSQLLRFRNVTGETFKEAQELSLDLAQAMGTDLNQATQLIGQALNEPEQGLTRLRRAGISFTEAQREQIETLIESGQVSQAQAIILGELEQSVGGAAAAATEAGLGAFQQLRNAFNDVLEQVGFLITEIMNLFLPAIQASLTAAQGLGNILQSLSGFIENNRGLFRALATVMGVLTSAIVAQTAANSQWLASKVAAVRGTISLTAAQRGLNNAMRANPIGLIVSLIAGLIVWLVDLSKRNETVAAAFEKLNEVISNSIEFIKGLVMNFTPLGQAIQLITRLFRENEGVITGWTNTFRDAMGGLFSVFEETFSIIMEGIGSLGSAFSNLMSGNFRQALRDAGDALVKTNPVGIAVTQGKRLGESFGEGYTNARDERIRQSDFDAGLEEIEDRFEKEMQLTREKNQELGLSEQKATLNLLKVERQRAEARLRLLEKFGMQQTKQYEEAQEEIERVLGRIADTEEEKQRLANHARVNGLEERLEDLSKYYDRERAIVERKQVEGELSEAEASEKILKLKRDEAKKRLDLLRALGRAETAEFEKVRLEIAKINAELRGEDIAFDMQTAGVKSLQAEIRRLQGELNSDDLSDTELEETIRKILELEERLEDVQGRIEAARGAQTRDVAPIETLPTREISTVEVDDSDRIRQLERETDLRVEQLQKQRDLELRNSELSAEDRLRIIKETDREIQDIRAESRIEELQLLLENEDLSAEMRLEKERELAQLILDENSKLNDDIISQDANRIAEVAEMAKRAFQSISDDILSITNDRVEREIERERDKYNSMIAASEDNEDRQERLEQERDARIEELEKEQFERQKRLSIAQTLINAAQAIISTFAASPGFADILTLGAARAVQVGMITASTIAQISAIRSQQFAQGGMLKGPSHAQGGIPAIVGGQPIEMEGGEAVINKRSMLSRDVMSVTGTPRQIASAINSHRGYGVKFQQGGMTPASVIPSVPNGSTLSSFDVERIAQAVRNGSFAGSRAGSSEGVYDGARQGERFRERKRRMQVEV